MGDSALQSIGAVSISVLSAYRHLLQINAAAYQRARHVHCERQESCRSWHFDDGCPWPDYWESRAALRALVAAHSTSPVSEVH